MDTAWDLDMQKTRIMIMHLELHLLYRSPLMDDSGLSISGHLLRPMIGTCVDALCC